VRHLTETQALGALSRGRDVEQLLASEPTVVEWLTLAKDATGITLRRHRVWDVGRNDFTDVSEFPPVDPEEDQGEGTVLATFTDAAEALTRSVEHGARADRWVNGGMVQGRVRGRD
jgi:hypothetical protein